MFTSDGIMIYYFKQKIGRPYAAQKKGADGGLCFRGECVLIKADCTGPTPRPARGAMYAQNSFLGSTKCVAIWYGAAGKGRTCFMLEW